MNLTDAKSFLLNGMQDLNEEEMLSIAGGYGPSYPGNGGSDNGCNCCCKPKPPGTNPYGG